MRNENAMGKNKNDWVDPDTGEVVHLTGPMRAGLEAGAFEPLDAPSPGGGNDFGEFNNDLAMEFLPDDLIV